KLLRATIIAAIIIRPRHCLAILFAAHFPPRLPRYSPQPQGSARDMWNVLLAPTSIMDQSVRGCWRIVVITAQGS
ncbi:hypothetical protein, partial [Bradyrhizobium guangdongense]|uniref:hypothetical protein n=1 Tax=Bradyrhizobium guangdongense TaxID=1325090 RepID=UPI001AEECDF6